MVEHDKKQFAEVLRSAFEIYGKTVSKPSMQLWWNCMAQFTIEQFSHAMSAHIACPDRGQYPPKPSDVIAKISGTRDDRKDAGEFAWRRVMHALETHGTYASVAFDDPAIHYAIEVAFGGWVKMGALDVDSPFPRKEFCNAYAAFRPGLPHQSYFVGIAETHNASGGMRTCKNAIALVGNQSAVKAVMDAGVSRIAEDVMPRLGNISSISLGLSNRAEVAA